MLVKIVKVSDKGQISLPTEMRTLAGIHTGDELVIVQEKGKILIERPVKISQVIKDDFKDLLKHSEKVAQKLWSSKEDDIWDTV